MSRVRVVALAAACYAVVARAQVPALVGYQGRLLKVDGAPESGVLSMTFAVYDAKTLGTALGCELQQVAVTDGFYSVILGGGAAACAGAVPLLAASHFDGADRYLEQGVAGAALVPRQRVVSVAYALRAGAATSVSGGVVDATSIKVAGTTVIDGTGNLADPAANAFVKNGTAAQAASFNVSGTGVVGGNLTVGGRVGIGTATPAAALHLFSPGTTQFNIDTSLAANDRAAISFRLNNVEEARIQFGDSGGHLLINPGAALRLSKPLQLTGAGDDSSVRSATNQPLTLWTNNAERARFDAAGNAGIGTTTPSAKLHVQQSTAGEKALVVRQGTAAGSGDNLLRVEDSTGQYRFRVDQFHNLYMTNAGGTDTAVMKTDGSVGVGTPSPAQKLHVVGNAQIDGNLIVSGSITRNTAYSRVAAGGCATSSAAPTAIPCLPAVTHTARGGTVRIQFMCEGYNQTNTAHNRSFVYVDGVNVAGCMVSMGDANAWHAFNGCQLVRSVGAGAHTYVIQWLTTGGTWTINDDPQTPNSCSLFVEDL